MINVPLRFAFALPATVAFLVFPISAFAQKQTTNKFPRAIERAEDAGLIISLLAVGDSGLPKELIDRAEAVAVFPRLSKDVTFIDHTIKGPGVISARKGAAWTPPAFYQFWGDKYGNPFAPNETFGLVMLFMTKDAVDWFAKGRVRLQGEKKAVAGPVGTLTDAERKDLANTQIVAYVYYNGKLSGTGISGNFFNTFLLNPDNKINQPLYGIKGREVLAGQRVDAASLPAGITAFQEALQKHYARP